MKILLPIERLRWAVGAAARAVPGRSTLPILQHLVLSAADGAFVVTGTDLEQRVEASLPGVLAEQVGALTVPARLLQDLLGQVGGTEVELSADKRSVLTVQCGRSRYTLSGLPVEEYPGAAVQDPAGVRLSVPAEDLRALINSVVYAVSRDECRVMLTGALLTAGGGQLRLAATDTHRLAVRTVAWVGAGECQAIIPGRALREIVRLLGHVEEPVTLTVEPRSVVLEVGGVRYSSRLIEGQFPAYDRVIPDNQDELWSLLVSAPELREAVRRCNVIASTESSKVGLLVDRGEEGASLRLDAVTEIGEAREQVAASLQARADPLPMAFAANYLLDALAVCGDSQCLLRFFGERRPMLITCPERPDWVSLTMPMERL